MTVRDLTDVILDSSEVRFFNERDEMVFKGPLYLVAQDGYFFFEEKEVLYIEARRDSIYEEPYLAITLYI